MNKERAINKTPTWLKVMQNGAIGEARAKAFLMDKFWILERSVDIDGADLIIQKRITHKNILDDKAPRLGVVQVKFFESENTTQYIHEEYIVDEKGNPRSEFFLLCFTGFADDASMFFLTSEMIFEDFYVVDKSNIKKYSIYGGKLLRNPKYTITSKSNTLLRIERALESAEFRNNRRFVSWHLPNINSDTSDILPEYREALQNEWGDIPTEFKRIKDSATKSMKEIEEIYDYLGAIVNENDPLEAFSKIELLNLDLGNSYGYWGLNIRNNLYSSDFYFECKNHKEKVDTLRNEGLLDNYLGIKRKIKTEFLSFIKGKSHFDSNDVYSMRIRFSVDDFSVIKIEHKIIDVDRYFGTSGTKDKYGYPKYKGFNIISENELEFFALLGRFRGSAPFEDDFWGYISQDDLWIYTACMNKMYEMKYYEIEDNV